MQASASRYDFEPPQPRSGTLRAWGLALLVHALLLAALTWGVSWRRHDTSVAVEAELWAAVPQEAAPRPAAAEPEPPPPPAPTAEPPQPSEAEIALARQRERKAREQAEQLRREQERQRLERERAERERAERERQARDKQLAEEKRRKEAEARRREQQLEAEREKLRQEQINRAMGLAGASGAPTASGTALRSAGPSASYAARIRARIKPNIVFADELPGNPSAEVEVRTAPDGTIVGRRIVKSSGVPAWDEAVLKAIDKTEVLPRNEEGIVPSPMTIIFRPKD
jgi:colicin import membrane protein